MDHHSIIFRYEPIVWRKSDGKTVTGNVPTIQFYWSTSQKSCVRRGLLIRSLIGQKCSLSITILFSDLPLDPSTFAATCEHEAATRKEVASSARLRNKVGFNDYGRSIKKCPGEVRSRQVVRYWEGDTVESERYDHQRKSSACFVTLVERVSRYYIATLVPERKQETVTQAIIKRLGTLPSDLVKTITFD